MDTGEIILLNTLCRASTSMNLLNHGRLYVGLHPEASYYPLPHPTRQQQECLVVKGESMARRLSLILTIEPRAMEHSDVLLCQTSSHI
jgi:hypothetical protein